MPSQSQQRNEFVNKVLTVEGKKARQLRTLLRKKVSADSLRNQFIEVLGNDLAPDKLPAWLLLGAEEIMDDVVHLAPPLFCGCLQDDDEFYAHTRKQVVLYGGKGQATHFKTGDRDQEKFPLRPDTFATVECYETERGGVLTKLRWLEPPPDKVRPFERLLADAGLASYAVMEAYDARDYRKSPAPTMSAFAAPSLPGGGGLFLADAARSANFPGKGPLRKPKILWHTDHQRIHFGGDERGGAVVAADGMLFGAGYSFNVYFAAVDLQGKTVWERRMTTGQSFPLSNPCVDRGILYLGTNHGLYALDAKTGKDGWLSKIHNISGTPLVVGDLCYLGTGKGLVALATGDGRKKWLHATKGQVATPAFGEGVLYCLAPGRLKALESERGKLLWEVGAHRWEYPHAGPARVDDKVVFRADNGKLAAVDSSSGKPKWACEFADNHGVADRPLAAGGGMVLAFDGKGALHGIDAKTGKRRWVFDSGGKSYSIGTMGPIIGGTAVYATIVEDREDTFPQAFLCALDLNCGRLLWRIGELSKELGGERASWYCPPTLYEGVLYVQTGMSLFALK